LRRFAQAVTDFTDQHMIMDDTTVIARTAGEGKIYSLFMVDEAGVEWFAGGYKNYQTAEQKGRGSGKEYRVRECVLQSSSRWKPKSPQRN
jgi:hypothetical protein